MHPHTYYYSLNDSINIFIAVAWLIVWALVVTDLVLLAILLYKKIK
jgi:hypothetical protein